MRRGIGGVKVVVRGKMMMEERPTLWLAIRICDSVPPYVKNKGPILRSKRPEEKGKKELEREKDGPLAQLILKPVDPPVLERRQSAGDDDCMRSLGMG